MSAGRGPPVWSVITPDDPRIADYAHVGDAPWLVAQGLFVAEGRLVVRRMVEAGTFTIRSVLLTPAARAALADVFDSCPLPVYVCEQQTMNAVAGFNFHRGCLALGVRPPAVDSLDRFTRVSRLLALEGVGNPDNVGGLFRVAAAFGVGGVLLDRTTGDPLYRKAIRTSMGASLRIPFARVDAWWPALQSLRSAGAFIAALTPDRSATPISACAQEVPSDRPLILMLGAEGPGLSAGTLQAADARVRIPIAADVDSLNVVVAAGIALAMFGPRR
jgi:tRNA G18 (ribose-2'-O)-methylase SpoU